MAPPGKQTTAAGRRKHRFPAPAAPPGNAPDSHRSRHHL